MEDVIELILSFLKSKNCDKEFLEKTIMEFQKKGRKNEDIDRIIKIIEKEKTKDKHRKEKELLEELEDFYKECKSEGYIKSGDEEDKRYAYANGDYYLEDYLDQLIEYHDGIQTYLEFLKQADEYFKQQRYEIAAKIYKVLIDIYEFDDKEACFIRDDDLPDATLSMCVSEVDIFTLKKNYAICIDRIEHPDKPLDYIELCIQNRKSDRNYYKELIEHLIKEKRWKEVIKYGEELIADMEHAYYYKYPEQVRDAYKHLNDHKKSI